MALPVPNLDDRRFQDLVDDAKRLVQRRCPEWSDHNVSDPGVTLIETFAYLTDQLLYRLNRVPDRLYVKFLDLIGLRLLPPTAATAPVTFWASAPVVTPLRVSAGTRVGTVRTELEESIEFSTTSDLDIEPRRLAQVRSSVEPDEDAPDGTRDRSEALVAAQPFPAFRQPPVVDDALLLGLDDPAPGLAVRIDFEGRVDGVGVNPDSPPLRWEAWTASGWEDCELGRDDTGGLNRSGTLILHVPSTHAASVIEGARAGWLRARVVEPEEGQPPYTASPIVHGLTACTVGGTVEAIHGEVIEHEILGEAEGVPAQSFTLSHSPLLRNGVAPVVEVSSEDGWQEWKLVDDFAESTADDRHVQLDPSAGVLMFGPVVREPDGSLRHYGAVPEKGATVRIRRYAVGGGRQGNVTAGALSTLRSSIPFVSAVENRRSAQGGVDGETLDEAKSRAPLLFRTRSRAVTSEDFEAIAREAAPDVARVRCVAAGAGAAAGSARVLIVPSIPADGGRIDFADLIPREETLERIARRLDDTRLIGTRVVVEPPLYRGITVVARLVVRPRVNADRVRDEAERALYDFLSPLPPGGPDGRGWPFGRPVQSGEIFGLLQRISGVDLVEDARLFSADPVTGARGDEARRIDVEENSLVFSYDHQIRVEAQ